MIALLAVLVVVASVWVVRGDGTCQISRSESCNLSKFPVGESVLIKPGGSTKCLLGEPYSFQVIRGDKSKILFHFQGGGACWDSASILINACSEKVYPVPADGIFDVKSLQNRYRTYTIISVLYCSGDLHIGDYDWDYDVLGFDKKRVYQRGATNFRSVITWLQKQVSLGEIGVRNNLDRLVLSGSSAGALGLQVWSGHLLARLPQARLRAVIVDSLAGLFPNDARGLPAVSALLKQYGVCKYITTLTKETSRFGPACVNGTLTVQNIFSGNMKANPTVPFAFLQSKRDEVQLGFFDGIDLIFGMHSDMLDGTSFSERVEAFLQSYNIKFRNWIVYWIDGDTHQYLTEPWFYKASVLGSSAGKSQLGVPLLHQWVAALPLGAGQNLTSFGADGYQGKTFIQGPR